MIRAAAMLAVLAMAAPAEAAVCKRWGQPERVGQLDPAKLPEASGLAISRQFRGRLYHHNDSGAGPVFFLSDAAGGALQAVALSIPRPIDMEDMTLGRCAGARRCLVFGDIGDNNSVRTQGVSLTVVAERKAYGETETPLRVIKARYPDGPHNAEGVALHPNGDLYLVTKADNAAQPTIIYRLTRAQLAVDDGSVQTFSEVGRFDLAAAIKGDPPTPPPTEDRAIRVTAFAIAPNGRRAVVLTYQGAVELGFDLSRPLPPQSQWKAGRDFRVVQTAPLTQAEAIAYTPDGRSLLYDSETAGGPAAPIYRQRCAARR